MSRQIKFYSGLLSCKIIPRYSLLILINNKRIIAHAETMLFIVQNDSFVLQLCERFYNDNREESSSKHAAIFFLSFFSVTTQRLFREKSRRVASWDGSSSSADKAIDIMNAISFEATRRTVKSVVTGRERLTVKNGAERAPSHTRGKKANARGGEKRVRKRKKDETNARPVDCIHIIETSR